MNVHWSLSSAVRLSPRRAGLRSAHDNTAEVLVRIQAPDAPAGHTAERPPQAVALVIDRSGSMSGPPIAQARRCAEYVVGALRPADTVSLVQFDHRVRRLWPAVPLGDGAAVRAAIASIQAGGQTDLHGGWAVGADTLVDVGGSGLKRVILLSDGQANQGLTDTAAIASQCERQAACGITTSTYGLGKNFNEDLMVAMARAGGGNPYYGDTAEDLMEPFQQELELLGKLCLRELRLNVDAPDGVTVSMVNDLPRLQGGWRLPDLAWGAEAWAVLRLDIAALALPKSGERMTVLRVGVNGVSLEGEPVVLERAGLALPVLAAAAHGALTEDELVQRRLTELAAASTMARMREAAAAERWDNVDQLLAEATHQFAGNEWVASVIESMKAIALSRSRERLSKEALYTASRLSSRLTARDEPAMDPRGAGPAYLRRKSSQGKDEF